MIDENKDSKLLKIIEDKKNKKNELLQRAKTVDNVDELRSIHTQAEILDTDIKQLEELIDKKNNELPDARDKEEASQIEGRNFNPIATYTTQEAKKKENKNIEDPYDTLEYRNAFKNYIIDGTPIPEKFKIPPEKRANELTTVGDVGAVIPTTIQNKVITDITTEGRILQRITTTSYQGGVEIPISDINFTATWLNSEEDISETQKAEMNAKLTFSYHVLEARVAIGLLTDTITLPIFENIIVQQLKKAMIRALETSIIKGTGSGQPLGFLNYDLPASQIVEMSSADISTVKGWANVEAIIPEEVENDGIYIMSKATWEKYLNGMTSTTGQKIGLGKINEKGVKILNGREVLTVSNLPSFDNATSGDIFAVVIDLSRYCLNSNLAMYYKKYFNDDANKWIHKSLMIADGKMAIGETGTGVNKKLVGAQGLIYIKKA